MPDKNYKRGCGNNCPACWRNRLKHANPFAKAYSQNNPMADLNTIVFPDENPKAPREMKPKPNGRLARNEANRLERLDERKSAKKQWKSQNKSKFISLKRALIDQMAANGFPGDMAIRIISKRFATNACTQ